MIRCNGVHHLAVSTADIKAQIEYFTGVLGMELKALYWMHGVEGAWHAFLEMNDHSYIAFVQMPAIEKIERLIGVSHAGSPGGVSAGGTMQHLAFNVDSLAELLAFRDRIRSHGITVLGPIHHGLCDSIYFAGPENLSLEVATSERAIDGRAWIDPEVVALAGISPAELARYRAPERTAATGGKVAQPRIDPTKPHMVGWPPDHIVAMPDDEFTARMSETEPPVRVDP
jgi:catechol 2,3-dioxygenase-like lactoylglutathione lyase family enzyme